MILSDLRLIEVAVPITGHRFEMWLAGPFEHQGRCPCHPATAALTSGARGGEATPHSQGEPFLNEVASSVRCARASVRRDDKARHDEPGARHLTWARSMCG